MSIIHRGTLTLEKLKELATKHLPAMSLSEAQKAIQEAELQGIQSINKDFGDNDFLIKKQKDGNWKAYTYKNGKLIQVREIDPMYCLQRLLTME